MDEEQQLAESEVSENTEENENGRSVSSDLIRGHINTIILRALYEGDKYGYEIIADIENKSHGQYSLKQPSLYSALKRLEKDGCVTSYWGGSVSGGRRKYFSLTDLGKEISERNQSEWEYSRTIIDSLISEKDFDFNNPAPNMVNMRILRDTTSRITREDGEEEEGVVRMGGIEADEALARRKEELSAAEAALEERKQTLLREQEWREEELIRREKLIEAAKQAIARQETDDGEKSALQLKISETQNEIALLNHLNETLKEELAQQERQNEDVRLRIIEEERNRAEEEVARANARAEESAARAEEAIENERNRFQSALEAERRRIAAEESRRAEDYVIAETERIKREQEEIFLKREQDLMRQNYRELMNAPAPAPAEQEALFAEQPAPAEPVQEEPVQTPSEPAPPPRPVLFEAAQLPEDDLPVAPQRSGVDFSEIEQRAIRDGIRVVTTGAKSRQQLNQEDSVRLVHKGKCLFMSSIVACLFCVVLGSILLGIRKDLAIPAFFPYFIWCVGAALLLAMGLAFANRYGERAIRRKSTIILINVAVIYALLVIITLIVALSARIDFSSAAACATFIYIPIVFELVVPIFGVVYYFLVRAKNEK